MSDLQDATCTDKFSRVHAEERHKLKLLQDLKSLDGIGLALSGGGIRSASFALGVVQALLNADLFKRIDYLSTVSGGGYLGSALSWWLHHAATDAALTPPAEWIPTDPNVTDEGQLRYMEFRQQFGSKVKGSRTDSGGDPVAGACGWHGSNWLAYIRQHGNYLQPPGVGYASLAASILRVCFYTVGVYAASLVGIFCLARLVESTVGAGPRSLIHLGLIVAASFAGLLLAMSVLYGPATWASSMWGSQVSSLLYLGRTKFRRWSGTLLSLSLMGLLVASIPALYDLIDDHLTVWLTSLSSLSLGTIGTIYQFFQGRAQSRTPAALGSLRLILTAALVIYGLSLGAFAVAEALPDSRWSVIATAGGSLILGLFVNTNYAGLARLYRDRLMEAFLPSPINIANNDWTLATLADTQKVSDLKGRIDRDSGRLGAATPDTCPRPLHLINCNTVLIDSPKDLYRNRGGDCFTISPLWSGSNATNWIKTPRLGDGAMSLATAMSISGAAANPNAAPNGLGVTRNRVVSFLMSLFNIRLGYWMANPARIGGTPTNKPNLWYPGFRQGLLGSGLSERAHFIELTDGGHFDNTGIYELVRRRTRVIIVSQGGCDPEFAMQDLANAIEKVRVDFSVFIEFKDPMYDLASLRRKDMTSYDPCERAFAIGRIRYPKGTATSYDYDDGYLLYMQAVPMKAMPSDVFSYWLRHKEFPNDTTADQFFTEENLEAYRELGYATADGLDKSLKGGSSDLSVLQELAGILQCKPTPTPAPVTAPHGAPSVAAELPELDVAHSG